MLKQLLIAAFLSFICCFVCTDVSAQHREIINKDVVIKNKSIQVGGDSYVVAQGGIIEIGTDSSDKASIRFHYTDTGQIASPMMGALIYNGSDSSFYYYTGNVWTRLATGSP